MLRFSNVNLNCFWSGPVFYSITKQTGLAGYPIEFLSWLPSEVHDHVISNTHTPPAGTLLNNIKGIHDTKLCLNMIQKFSQQKFDVDERDSAGCSPLNYCIRERRIPEARILIEKGANITHVYDKTCAVCYFSDTYNWVDYVDQIDSLTCQIDSQPILGKLMRIDLSKCEALVKLHGFRDSKFAINYCLRYPSLFLTIINQSANSPSDLLKRVCKKIVHNTQPKEYALCEVLKISLQLDKSNEFNDKNCITMLLTCDSDIKQKLALLNISTQTTKLKI